MSRDLLAAALTAGVGVLAGLAGPFVIARLREPEAEAPGPPRPLYVELAGRRLLGLRLAIVGAGVGALVGWQVGWTPILAAWAVLTASCLLLGYVDARTRLLPTQLISPSYLLIVATVLGAGILGGDADGVWHAFLGWLAMGGFYLVLWRLGPRGLGYGDVRLSGLLALCLGYLGWGQLATGLYAGFLLAGIASLLLVATGRASLKTAIPFGPYMMLGTMLGLIWGDAFWRWSGH